MRAQRPDVARLRDRFGGRFRDGIGRIVRYRQAVVVIGQQRVQVILGDPDKPEVEILGQQCLQFLQQQCLVSAAQLSQFVVGDAIRPALGFSQMTQHDDRGLGQAEVGGREDATVASDQFAIGRHQHRHGPAELGHARGDLRYLIGVMGLGVAGVRLQPGERPMFDPARQQGRISCREPLGLQVGEGFAGVGQDGVRAGELLPALDCHIDISRV